jgi:hypothetical protein
VFRVVVGIGSGGILIEVLVLEVAGSQSCQVEAFLIWLKICMKI